MIDLRSDTVTKPTAAMRQAMANAVVGDDVLGDDPTVIALEQKVCQVLGSQAAVYMPSGTMTNQVAIRSHTEAGDEIILEANSHVYYYEGGAPAGLSGVMCRLIDGDRGLFSAAQLKKALRPANLHHPRSRLVCLENTHNRGGGTIWPLEQMKEVAAVARDAGLSLHLDGARLWNASAATGIAERQYAELFDSVSVCFSKGLGAPVGSALAGSSEFIARARRFRKMFGGGMRQAGIIAAGALYALEHHRDRLKEDHANAQHLAKGLAGLKGIEIDAASAQTNIVIFRVPPSTAGGAAPAAELAKRIQQAGVAVMANGPETIRAVTSLEVTAADIDRAVEIIAEVLHR